MLLLAALAVALSAPPAAHAGGVVLLRSRGVAPFDTTAAAFRAACGERVTDFCLAPGNEDSVVRAIAARHPDVVVTIGRRATVLAQARLPRTPIVFGAVRDAEHLELAGPWVTGVLSEVSPAEELQALRRAAPGVRRVGVVYGRVAGAARMPAVRAAARAAGLRLLEAPLDRPSQLSERASALTAHADAFWLTADSLTMAPEVFRYLVDLSLSTRRPLLVFSESLVRSGALLAVTPDYHWVGTQLALQTRRVRAGESPGQIPVVPLKRTRIAFNIVAARALALQQAPPLVNLTVVP